MSFTVVQRPQGYQPVYNNLDVKCVSTSAEAPKFQYCMDVSLFFPPLSSNIQLGRYKARPISDIRNNIVNAGYFNLSDILQSRTEFSTWPTFILENQAWRVDVQMGFELAASTSAAAVYTPTSSFSFVGYNGALPISEFQSYDSLNLIKPLVLSATSGLALAPLTSLPNRKILSSSELYIDYLNNAVASRYLVKFFNGSTLLNTTSGSAGASGSSEVYRRINFSPSQFAIPSGANRYTVELIRNSNTNPLTTPYEVLLNSQCSRFDKVNVYYQNKYGAEDVFVFTLKSTKQSNIERMNYERGYGLNTPYSVQGTNTYSSKITRQHVLNTDWLTQAESEALSELVESNNVFIAFDGPVTYTGGSKAEVRVYGEYAPEIPPFGEKAIDAAYFITLNTSTFGTLTWTAGDVYSGPFIEDAMAAVLSEIIASPIGTYYDVTLEFDAGVSKYYWLFKAKNIGTSSNITSVSTRTTGNQDEFRASVSGNVAGTNFTSVNYPQRIPVTVNNESFDYKKKINGDLIQIELQVTEKANYERQAK